jgi:Putative amidoligase enzyme/KTSC domain
MCRSRAVGGRRCPLHSDAGFIGTHVAMKVSGLDARQTNAGFRVLRVEGENASEPTPEQWAQWLQTQADLVEQESMHGRTRTALRERVVNAAEEIPDGPTFYALQKLQERSITQKQALEGALQRIALANGKTMTQTRRDFAALRHEVDMSRDAPLPDGYSPRVFSAARNNGLPLDTPTIHALGKINNLGDSEFATDEPRVTHSPVDSTLISSAGYDATDGRLEVKLYQADGSVADKTYAYHNVPESVWSQFQDDPVGTYNRSIRGHGDYMYSSARSADQDSTRRRCADCGQFAGMSHTCPEVNSTPTPPLQRNRRATPNSRSIARMAAAQERIAREQEEQLAREQAEQAARAEQEAVAVANASVAAAADAPEEYTTEELKNHIAMYERQPIPYGTEDVTNGLCSPDGGMGFGIEIEIIADPTDQGNIALALAQAGLTANDSISGYHTGRSSGWARWSLERDETVDLELVSPILHDTPEDWEQLRQVMEIVKENGGSVNSRTGGHIHISSGSLGDSVTKHAELVNSFNEHEDVMYRLGTEQFGDHRPTYWCSPNRDANDVYVSPYGRQRTVNVSHLAGTHGGHNVALNIADSNQGSASHVEFRHWDGSLDPAVVQARIMLSAAMVHRASQVESGPVESINDIPVQRERRGIGHHYRSIGQDGEHTGFVQLQNEMFTRPEDRERLASLYANTKWQDRISNDDPSYDDDYPDYDYDDRGDDDENDDW